MASQTKKLQRNQRKTSQQLPEVEQTRSKMLYVLFVTVRTLLQGIFEILDANVQVVAKVKLLSTQLLQLHAQAGDLNEGNVEPPPKRMNPRPVPSQDVLQPRQQGEHYGKRPLHQRRTAMQAV